MDILSRSVALIIILLLAPFLLVLCLSCFFLQGKPIFYRQKRIGHKYEEFILYKFRTMRNNNSGPLITKKNDKRITKLGKILRSLKIDELPQLYNILIGNMRFIGPRPEIKKYVNKSNFKFLKNIKPGLADFSSILLRNEPDILLRYEHIYTYDDLLKLKIKLADLYTLKKSFLLDLSLVFVTIISIVFPNVAIFIIKKFYIEKYKKELIPDISKWV